MKAADFRYERPATLEAALAVLAEAGSDAAPLAGGQSLMPMMNFRLARPEVLVDLGDLGDLAGVRREGGRVVVGAMTRYAALMRSEIVAEHVPLLAAALPHVAHPAIRNRGTIGGSMALADPAAELPAVALALGAVITLRNAAGARRIPADDFFLGMYETALEAGELVTEVDFPEAADGDRFAFHELAQRHGDYAMAGVAVAAKGPDALSEVRVAFFGVAERALRVSGAEAALAGRRADDPAALADAVAALDVIDFAADPATGAATRRHLAGVVLRRALGEI